MDLVDGDERTEVGVCFPGRERGLGGEGLKARVAVWLAGDRGRALARLFGLLGVRELVADEDEGRDVGEDCWGKGGGAKQSEMWRGGTGWDSLTCTDVEDDRSSEAG